MVLHTDKETNKITLWKGAPLTKIFNEKLFDTLFS